MCGLVIFGAERSRSYTIRSYEIDSNPNTAHNSNNIVRRFEIYITWHVPYFLLFVRGDFVAIGADALPSRAHPRGSVRKRARARTHVDICIHKYARARTASVKIERDVIYATCPRVCVRMTLGNDNAVTGEFSETFHSTRRKVRNDYLFFRARASFFFCSSFEQTGARGNT